MRPETADLRRRIHEAAIRNGTDPADLPRIHRINTRAEQFSLTMTALTSGFAALGRAFEQAAAAAPPALAEFEEIGAAYEKAIRERKR